MIRLLFLRQSMCYLVTWYSLSRFYIFSREMEKNEFE